VVEEEEEALLVYILPAMVKLKLKDEEVKESLIHLA